MTDSGTFYHTAASSEAPAKLAVWYDMAQLQILYTSLYFVIQSSQVHILQFTEWAIIEVDRQSENRVFLSL